MKTTRILMRTSALCAVSALAFLAVPAAAETQLPGVTVYSTTPLLPSDAGTAGTGAIGEGQPQPNAAATTVEDPESPARPPVIGDSGDFLRHVNGVDAARMGGHGLDPVIRGLDQNQIGITNDGAYHFGGCPNRMDPPTSHMQLYTYDKVTVKKGYQSVLDGPPAPGGTIAFERVNPTFAPGMDVSTNFKAGAGYNSNGSGRESFVDMSMGNDWGYIRGFGSYGAQENYEDGNGDEVRSNFDQFGGGVILGRTFDRDSFITLKVENNNVDDALFPGSGMDAPETDDWTYQIKAETDLDWGIIRGMKSDVYLTTVDHVMNNFDLRPQANNFMEARTESDTAGGKLVFDGEIGTTTFNIGTDYRDNMRDGDRYVGANGNYDPTTVQSILWGDTSIKEWALFGETVVPLAQYTKMTMGVRFAHVDASADRTDQIATATGKTANQLYDAFYGADGSGSKTENNIGGLLRLEQELAPGLTLFGTASRSVRTADATERYIASFMGTAGAASWVGNPDLDPEQHHQVELGTTYKGGAFDLKGSVYYNRVTDYIQMYSGQNLGMVPGVGNFTNVSLYRNIDAALAGTELEATVRLTDVWRVTLAGAYTYGENLTDDTALGQIAPLSGRFELVYDDTRLLAGLRLNAQADQTRTDADSSRQDFGETDGWATVDLFGAYNFTENFQLSAGVTNVLDNDYAYHLNKKDALGQSYQVSEPGRSFYVRAVTKF